MNRWNRLLSIALCSLAAGALGAAEPGKANRLAKETSPYLKLHANNPVDWRPWGPEALDAAKKSGKPIFLSIGYSSCHWCHVMNRESFVDPAIAAKLNEHFVCIKVDREERPDVDAVYLAAVQALQDGGGGWPLSVFLLPDGRPFFGGTYFPPADRVGPDGKLRMPGFPRVLDFVLKALKERPEDVERQAAALSDYLRRGATAPMLADGELTPAVLDQAEKSIQSAYDPEHGGLGEAPRFAPKFPQPAPALFLLEQAARKDSRDPLLVVLLQANRMALGGIYDQVGGGFHRYAVDRTWTVPHFEKMLYDQGQLLSLYSRLQRIAPDPLYARIVSETVEFLARELAGPDGLYYAALDADSEHEEGKFYVWTRAEFQTAAGDDAAWAAALLGLDRDPNFEKSYVLERVRNDEDPEVQRRWQTVRERLLAARSQRTRPLLDTKEITAWNAFAVVGLADAAEAFANDAFRRRALATADAMRRYLRRPDGGALYRHRIDGEAKGDGYADDYAGYVRAMLAAHRLTKDPSYLREAEVIADQLTSKFWDEGSRSFLLSPKGNDALIAPHRDASDGALPGSHNLAVLALSELAARTGSPERRDRVGGILRAWRGRMVESPIGSSTLLRALLVHLSSGPRSEGSEPIAKIVVSPRPVELKGRSEAEVTLKVSMKQGWHVNANPASPDYLKPLELRLPPEAPFELVDVRYPPGKELKVGGFDDAVRVYEGEFEIQARVRAGADAPAAGSLKFELKYQACDDARCLSPAMRSVEVPFLRSN